MSGRRRPVEKSGIMDRDFWTGTTYSADENESRITLVEDVLVQIRHPVVPDRDVRKEWQRPRVSRAYDESIDLFDRGVIDEVDCSACDVRD